VEIILTHQNADFDAVASMLAASKIYPNAVAVLPSRQHASVREFLMLYRNGLPFIHWDDFRPRQAITRIVLTDTQSCPDAKWIEPDTPVDIIDHHMLERDLKKNERWAGDDVGAATTLLIEQMRKQDIKLSSLEATLLALGIYTDTGSLTYGGTTARDIRAAAWLLEQGAVLDTISRFLANPLNAEQQTLFEALFENVESRTLQGYDVTLCLAHFDKTINGINSVTARLQDIMDSDAMFVLVDLPKHIQLVCRSKVDAIDVGELAKSFGGGGHPRAAAAAIYKGELEAVGHQIWAYLRDHIYPATRVADLMSFGAQTVGAGESIQEIIARLRRIGHEGYPVLEEDEVVGLLTLRDADKALEHGLKAATARDVMLSGHITLKPDDPVSRLEETMVNSNWGQIPVINDQNRLIGIVTRTDLIKHWGHKHPSKTPELPQVDPATVQHILGQHNLSLIQTIAAQAHDTPIPIYIVGGIVRDLLLERSNYDMDIVVEGDAIAFAENLRTRYGGRIHSYEPFGTAKWRLDEEAVQALNLPASELPDHIDFATARSELYEHPTALPTVYNSGIKLDLRRRDFTMNTLAIQLSPQDKMWQILDFYGGMEDLNARLIRVLHSLSFIDDPTRILRAVRFGERLHFIIEPRTAELMQTAKPMLRRITGERLRSELTLLLKEENPARGILKLEALGALESIHPALQVKVDVREAFTVLQSGQYPQWVEDDPILRWHLVMAHVASADVYTVSKRLLFGENHAQALAQTAHLVQKHEWLQNPDARPSVIDSRLAAYQTISLVALWICVAKSPVRQKVELYHDEWQTIKPTIDGNQLRAMGLEPGPHYRMILQALRAAWLDGEIQTVMDEQALLHKLMREVNQ